MSRTLYEQSLDHIAVAEAALRERRTDDARVEYANAARNQEAMIQDLGADRPRTRTTFGLSAATLYFRAHDLDGAERLACLTLADPGTEERTRNHLRELLAEVEN